MPVDGYRVSLLVIKKKTVLKSPRSCSTKSFDRVSPAIMCNPTHQAELQLYLILYIFAFVFKIFSKV